MKAHLFPAPMQLPTHGQKWSNMATQRLLMAQCLALKGRTICTANAQTRAKFSGPRLLQADDMPLVAPVLAHKKIAPYAGCNRKRRKSRSYLHEQPCRGGLSNKVCCKASLTKADKKKDGNSSRNLEAGRSCTMQSHAWSRAGSSHSRTLQVTHSWPQLPALRAGESSACSLSY